MKKLKQVLRWIAVLPGSLLAGVLVIFLIHWLALAIHFSGGPFYGFITQDGGGNPVSLKQLEYSMNSLFVSATIIFVGALIAPKHRFATAISLTILIFCLGTVLFFTANNYGLRMADSTFVTVLHIIFILFGVINALLFARELDDQKS